MRTLINEHSDVRAPNLSTTDLPMSWNNTADRYGSLSIFMHWLMLALLIGVYACINVRELYPKGSDLHDSLKMWHFMLGLSVFALVWLRLAGRLVTPSPHMSPQIAPGQRHLAGLIHAALYALSRRLRSLAQKKAVRGNLAAFCCCPVPCAGR